MTEEREPACVRGRIWKADQSKIQPSPLPLTRVGLLSSCHLQDTQICIQERSVLCDTPRAHGLVLPRARGRARGRYGAVLARSKPPERTLVPDALDDPLVGAPGNPSQASTRTGDLYPRAPRGRRGRRDARRLRHEPFHKSSTPPGRARTGYLLIVSSRWREPTATGRSAVDYAGSSN